MQRLQIAPHYFSWQKRLFDVFFAGSGAILLLPLLTGIAVLIWILHGPPIFFVQERLGRNKQSFWMMKFRTMRSDADVMKKKLMKQNEAPWPMFKMKNDPRFTTLGQVLSRTGFDELPQLWHILTGEMSLIGPRPLPVEEANKLDKSWNFRYLVRPGILSEWAIHPNRHKSLKEWQLLERETLTTVHNIQSEIKILQRTIRKLYT